MQVILCYRRRRSAGRAVHEGQTETHAQYVNIGKSELHFWGAAGKTDKLTKHIAAKKTHVQITGMQIACNLQKIGFMIMPSLKECFFVASICMFGITAQKKLIPQITMVVDISLSCCCCTSCAGRQLPGQLLLLLLQRLKKLSLKAFNF